MYSRHILRYNGYTGLPLSYYRQIVSTTRQCHVMWFLRNGHALSKSYSDRTSTVGGVYCLADWRVTGFPPTAYVLPFHLLFITLHKTISTSFSQEKTQNLEIKFHCLIHLNTVPGNETTVGSLPRTRRIICTRR